MTELLADLPVRGPIPPDLEVLGVALDSRKVEAGDLFVALTGANHDARAFAREAAAGGAVAVLAEGPPLQPAGVPWMEIDAARPALGSICSRLWSAPDRELRMVGITGTNGKTTVAELVSAMLEAAGEANLREGTLGSRRAGCEETRGHSAGLRTTPEAPDLYRALRDAVDAGAQAAVLEVSSHALVQGRVGALSFDVAVFTNLSRDHFDFHAGWEDYFAAKRRLFEQLKPGATPVVCIDDEYGRRLAADCEGALTYGLEGSVRAAGSELSFDGIRAEVETPRGRLEVRSRLVGAYNLSNLLAAVAVGEACGLDHSTIAAGIERLTTVNGRLERVPGGVPAFIDYAHTPAGLEAVLTALRDVGAGHLIVVFGCGGDRDPGRRAPMGEVAGRIADLAIITSDNPRTENPQDIFVAIEQGLQGSKIEYRIEPDRRQAIRLAVHEAGPDSLILVAGKGHEEVQIVGRETLPWSDRDELSRALAEVEGGRR